MDARDKTTKLIPINTLERILKDNNTFFSFLNRMGEFAYEREFEEIVSALNNYMSYIIRHESNISKEMFERINYINNLYNVQYNYNYEYYLDSTVPIVTIKEIEDILKNEDLFNKFMDFDNNSKDFRHGLFTYILAINDYYESLTKLNLDFNSDEYNRYKQVMKKYSLDLKRTQTLPGDVVTKEVDPSIVEVVIGKYQNIDNMTTFDKFAMARDIYISLCNMLSYDIGFASKDQHSDDSYVVEKYNEDISNINIHNTSVVCKTFSEIYAVLLNKVGIKATVAGGYHKYVLFDCDGTLMKADGTNVCKNDTLDIRMNDVTAVKMGFDTSGFTCLESDKDISEQIRKADSKNKFIKASKEQKFISDVNAYKARSNVQVELYQSFEDRIAILSDVSRNTNLRGLELAQYFTIMLNNMFKNMNIDVDYRYITVKDSNDEYKVGVLLTRKIDNDYQIYTFFDTGIQMNDRHVLLDYINSGNITVMSSTLPRGMYENSYQQEEVQSVK